MLLNYRGTKTFILSLIMVVGHVNGASSSDAQNPGPHGLENLGAFQIKFPENNLLGLMATAKVERFKSGRKFRIDYLPFSNEILGEPFDAATLRLAWQSPRIRTVDDFLTILQRNKKWYQPPLQTSFWCNFVWAGGIPLALLCGIYKMPFIKDMDAYKRACIAGFAAAVGFGFACKGLFRLHVPYSQTKGQITAQAIEQHNRFIDDKKILFADVIKRALESPIEGDYAHTYIEQLGQISHRVDRKLEEQKINSENNKQPSVEILQEVRTAYLQAQAPAARAYAAGGLIGLGSGLVVAHQLGGFSALCQLIKK